MSVPARTPRSVQLYRLLIRLYPASYRRDFGPLTLQLFSDIYRDATASPPAQRALTLAAAFADTLLSIGREQIDALKHRLNVRHDSMKKTPRPYYIRHRKALVISGAVVIGLGAASIFSGFWTYSGPVGYIKLVIQAGMMDQKQAASINTGWDNIAAFFVNDYVQAHYYGDKRTDVGINSSHALNSTYSYRDKTYTQSLKANLNTDYATKDPNFDDITCSTQAPAAVRYLHEPEDGHGNATAIAAFSYAGQSEPNLVQYDLRLDQTKSTQGDWKVVDITCLSLSLQPTQPYVTRENAEHAAALQEEKAQGLTVDPAANAPYDSRNDRTFGAAAKL